MKSSPKSKWTAHSSSSSLASLGPFLPCHGVCPLLFSPPMFSLWPIHWMPLIWRLSSGWGEYKMKTVSQLCDQWPRHCFGFGIYEWKWLISMFALLTSLFPDKSRQDAIKKFFKNSKKKLKTILFKGTGTQTWKVHKEESLNVCVT